MLSRGRSAIGAEGDDRAVFSGAKALRADDGALVTPRHDDLLKTTIFALFNSISSGITRNRSRKQKRKIDRENHRSIEVDMKEKMKNGLLEV